MPLIANVHVPTSWDLLLTEEEQEQRRKAEQDRSKLEQWAAKQYAAAKHSFELWNNRS